ncbi:MAG: hypothetical protein ACE5Q8_07615 [Nitrosopumilus sp.]
MNNTLSKNTSIFLLATLTLMFSFPAAFADNDDLEFEVEIEDGVAQIEVEFEDEEYEFKLATTDIDEILEVTSIRTGISVELLEEAMELEVKTNDEAEDEVRDDDESEIEIEAEIEDGIAKIKIEIKDEESRFKIVWIDKQTTIKEIALRTDLSIEQISNSISFEFEDNDKREDHEDDLDEIKQDSPEKFAENQSKTEEKILKKLAKTEAKLAKVQERLSEKLTKLDEKLTEKEKISEERANKILERIQKETLKTDQRIQKLLDKYQSGKYFGNIENKDTTIRSFTISFEGTAVEISDSSNTHALSGELFLENQVTGNNVNKFRVTGGELLVGDVEVYDVVFGKARTSSSGSGDYKDSMVIIAQTSDGVDVKTLKLNIDLSEELNSKTDSADIKILFPQSKISSQWFLSGIGSMGLTESMGNAGTETIVTEPIVTEPENIPHTTTISISVSQKSYVAGDEIIISGIVEKIFENTPVIIQTITNSDLVEIAQIDVASNGEFTHSIQAIGSQWQTSETYTVKAFYGENNVVQTSFEFSAE